MNHIIFTAAARTCQVFDAGGALRLECEARNDTVETEKHGPKFYGHFGACPVGEYSLGRARDNAAEKPGELVAEGPYYVPLVDVNGLWLANDRSDIGVHGGGTELPAPDAPEQGWAVTLGCWRLQNADLRRFVALTASGDRVTVVHG